MSRERLWTMTVVVVATGVAACDSATAPTVEGGTVTRVTHVSGNDQVAVVGQSLSEPLVARAVDAWATR